MKKTGWGNDPRSNRTAGCIVVSPSRRASTVRGACSVSSGSSHPGCFWRATASWCVVAGRLGTSAAGERIMGLARACGGSTGRVVQGIAASMKGKACPKTDLASGLDQQIPGRKPT